MSRAGANAASRPLASGHTTGRLPLPVTPPGSPRDTVIRIGFKVCWADSRGAGEKPAENPEVRDYYTLSAFALIRQIDHVCG